MMNCPGWFGSGMGPGSLMQMISMFGAMPLGAAMFAVNVDGTSAL